MRILNEIRFQNIRGDIFGGVTAAVITLPTAHTFGVASQERAQKPGYTGQFWWRLHAGSENAVGYFFHGQ
jgi:MFS superfamily sulfate permease-like transporter